jgi:hypothetical protein
VKHHASESSFIWATLSLGAFLITFVYGATLGSSLEAFGLAALALLAILAIEWLLRGSLWMFEPRFRAMFEDPKMPLRMLIFTGSIVFFLETIVLLGLVMPQATRAFPFCGAS